MQYMGGKVRQAPGIRAYIESVRGTRTDYVEPFIGGGSVFSEVASLFDTATAGDVVPELIALWQDVRRGWVPPESMTEELWRTLKMDATPSAMKGWAAYAGSYKGKYFAGYNGNYAARDYMAEAQRGIVKKVSRMPKSAQFRCVDYSHHAVTANTVVYCDPPYADTESYSGAGSFDHQRFWRTAEAWVEAGALVLVHEYSAPDGWEPVLVTDRVETMHHQGSSGVRKEILFSKVKAKGAMPVQAEEFFAAPEAREPSRPRAVNPLTGKEQSWTRASNYAGSLDNPHGLIVWQLRELVRGLALRPDLARMILAGVPLDDDPVTAKSKVDEIIKGAHGTAGIDAKANDGTAIHSALSRSWVHGIASVPEEFHKYVHAFAAACKEYGLRPVATEQTVLNTRRGSRGTFDWLMQEADGSHVIVDVKSGRLDVAKRKFAVQLAVYDEADFVLHTDGSASPIQWDLRRPYAVLIHVDPETAAVSVYKLDLLMGRLGAELAEKVRQWHTFDPMTPYSPPFTTTMGRANPPAPPPLHPTQTAAVVGTALPGVRAQQAGTLPHHTQTSSVAAHVVEAAIARGDAPPSPSEAWAIAEDTHPGVTVNEHGQDGVTVNEHPEVGGAGVPFEPTTPPAEPLAAPEKPYDPAERFDALMKGLDKAELQMHLKSRGWTDLSHNRRWLARALVVMEQGWTDEKMIRKYAAAKDDAGGDAASPLIDAAAIVEVQRHDDATDRAATRREVALTAIAGAKSVGALAAFHADFVGRHGDAAWTDELAEAAKARTSELDGIDTAATLARIELCEEQADLSELWSEVTLGGTVKSLWAPFEAAGKERMGVIRDRMMAQKTDNPFG